MAKQKPEQVHWMPDVVEGNYAAAGSYLGLLYPGARVAELMARLRAAPLVRFKAKDIFRASGLSLLGVSNSHVEKDLEKIREQVQLSPLLLVRDEARGKAVIADGYHRLCAVYQYDEDAEIPCRIV